MSAPAMNVDPGADEDDSVGLRVGVAARDGLVDRGPDRRTQRIDGRVVDGHDRDAVTDGVVDESGIEGRL